MIALSSGCCYQLEESQDPRRHSAFQRFNGGHTRENDV